MKIAEKMDLLHTKWKISKIHKDWLAFKKLRKQYERSK